MKKIKLPEHWIKILFFAVLIRPLILLALGLNIRNRPKLPTSGPAIIAANHTSHLDALVLMSLFPLRTLPMVRPVAAADYFLKNKWITWFSTKCLDIIPIQRQGRLRPSELFQPCWQALDRGEILIIFPEGTRSLTEDREYKLKRGIHILVKKCQAIPVIPVLLRGLGKSLPKNEALFVPFNCDVLIDDPVPFDENHEIFLKSMEDSFNTMLEYCITK